MSSDTLIDSVEGVLPDRLTALIGDGLFRDSAILIVASLLSGGLNYLFQIVMGRLLGPEQYGVFGSLFSLSYLVTVLSTGVGYCATKYVSSLSEGRRSAFLTGFTFRVGAAGVLLLLLLLAATPAISAFLGISDPLLVAAIVVSLVLSLFVSLNRGALQGVQRFVIFGAVGVGRSALKLVVGVGLVLLGFGVYGALGALLIASLAALFATTLSLRGYYANRTAFDSFGDVYRYAVPSMLVAFCFTIPTNADVVLVKSMFTASETGVYTAVTVFGKVLVFLPSGITSALFPKVSTDHASGEETNQLLRRALLYTGVLVAGATGATILFPEWLLTLVFGASYARGATLLPWYGAMVAVFSLNLVFLNFAHARNERFFVYVFAVLTVAELTGVYLFAESMLSIIRTMLLVNVAILLIGVVLNLNVRVKFK